MERKFLFIKNLYLFQYYTYQSSIQNNKPNSDNQQPYHFIDGNSLTK